MFGPMHIERYWLEDGPGKPVPDLHSAVARLLELTDYPEVVRWIQFPSALLLFLVVPGDPESGAFYIYDRSHGTWFWLDFEDDKFGGYSVADFDCLVRHSHFLSLVEQPWLLECDGKWFVSPGSPLSCRFDCM
jgi:hypothetical protein